MNEFKTSDVLAEIGLPQKWVVWCADENGYIIQHCSSHVESGIQRYLGRDEVERRFVKVGYWCWKSGREAGGDGI